MNQEEISRATVERLRTERAGVTDPEYAAALDDQIRIHSELAGLYLEVPTEPAPDPTPAKRGKAEG